MKHNAPNRLTEFFNGKGFYIILILCVAAIGVSGYILFFQGNSSSLDDAQVFADGEYMAAAPSGANASDAVESPIFADIPEGIRKDSEVIMAEDYDRSVSGSADIPAEKPVVTDESDNPVSDRPDSSDESGKLLGEAEAVSGSAEIPAEPSDEPSNESSDEPSAAGQDEDGETEVVAPFFVWPVSGEVLNGFSVDELVFNSTTEDWRIHTGIDIAAPAGTHIGAIGDGVVEDVYEDEMMGWSVVINHGNGLRSISRGLMADIPVSTGDVVKAGETIGGVGNSAELESALPSHMHLELVGDGAQLDPLEILP